MRTTLALDDDVFLLARQLAQKERITLGEAVSRLARDGCRYQNLKVSEPPLRSRYSVLPARDELVTSEHVRRLIDEEGI